MGIIAIVIAIVIVSSRVTSDCLGRGEEAAQDQLHLAQGALHQQQPRRRSIHPHVEHQRLSQNTPRGGGESWVYKTDNNSAPCISSRLCQNTERVAFGRGFTKEVAHGRKLRHGEREGEEGAGQGAEAGQGWRQTDCHYTN
jgi:hypothetical protein